MRRNRPPNYFHFAQSSSGEKEVFGKRKFSVWQPVRLCTAVVRILAVLAKIVIFKKKKLYEISKTFETDKYIQEFIKLI